MSAVPPAGEGNAIVAVGANLPGRDGMSPLDTCRAAVAALDGVCGLRLAAVSRWWRTAPVPPDPLSPDYCNGVAVLRGRVEGIDPAELLRALLSVEERFGRDRPRPNAPRTLDLDLIALGGIVRTAPDPVLPHPRAHLRRFVLAPLADVSPEWVHPVLGRNVLEMLAELPVDDAAPLPEAPSQVR